MSLRLAVVTSSSPLRIREPGASTDLIPSFLVGAAPAVGSAVLWDTIAPTDDQIVVLPVTAL